jgi:hypothetical protein
MMQAKITTCSSGFLLETSGYFQEAPLAGDMLSTSEVAEYLDIHEKQAYLTIPRFSPNLLDLNTRSVCRTVA